MLHFKVMRYFLILALLTMPLFYAQGENDLTSEQFREEARSYRTTGYKLQSMGDIRQAIVYYQKACELDPHYVEVINDLAVAYEQMGDEEAALRTYRKALEVRDNYLPTYTNLAFLYEKKGDITNATQYWAKRYELGEEGEYWREVASEHLLKLGTYPEIKKSLQEKEAVRLSRDLVYTREQERLKTIEEAKLHYDIGSNLFLQNDYEGALKEFETALSLNPADEELKVQLMDFRKKADVLRTKQRALADIEIALNDIKKEEFLSAAEKLRNALSAVFRLAQEK